MNEYAHKIANPSKFFIGGEWVDASRDTLDGAISLLAESYSCLKSTKDENVVIDLIARSRNCDGNENALGVANEFGRDDRHDRSVARLPGVSVILSGRETAGRERDRNSKDLTIGVSKCASRSGQRDPIAVYRTELLCRLLEPIRPAAWGGRPVLWPLWAGEMVHRTYVTIHLTALLMSKLKIERDASMRCELDYQVASNLAAAIGELVIVHDNERLPCSAVIRGIAHNFVELFGPVAGDIKIATRIEPLQLAAFKRRALALAVVALISEALVNASRGLDGGHIEVQLARISRSHARLSVKSNGNTQLASVLQPQACHSIGHDLASLLEAEIDYGISGSDGTAAQIDFLI